MRESMCCPYLESESFKLPLVEKGIDSRTTYVVRDV
jgi:hypothetical protein